MSPIAPLWAFVLVTLILSAGQTLFAALLLLLAKHPNKKANYYLAAFMVVLSTTITLFFLFDFWVLYFPHLILSYQPLVFLMPPLLWFYVKQLTNPGGGIKFSVFIAHFFPAIVVLLVLLPFYTLAGIEKVEWHYRQHLHLVRLGDIQTFTITIMIVVKAGTIFQGLVYGVAMLKRLKHHRMAIKNQFSNVDSIQLRWLVYLIWSCLFIYIFVLFNLVLDNYFDGSTIWALNVISGALLLSVFGFFGVVQKSVYGKGGGPLPLELAETDDANTAVVSSPTKYISSNLSDDHVKALYKELLDYMDESKPYLSANLMVTELAEALCLPAREMSRVINQMAGVSFLDFVNGYRLREAKKLLKVDKNMNVLDVAMRCGFNSKSAFYQVFKKTTNMTPSAYRKQAAAESTV